MLGHLLPSLAWSYHIAQHSLRPPRWGHILPPLCANGELVLLCNLPAGWRSRMGTSGATRMGTSLGAAWGCPPIISKSTELSPA